MSSIWNPQDRFILSNMTSEKLYAKSPLTTGVSGTSAYIGLEPSATYNETVLWVTPTPSNPSYVTGGQTSAISLSDSYTNYNTIRLVYRHSWGSYPGQNIETEGYDDIPVSNATASEFRQNVGGNLGSHEATSTATYTLFQDLGVAALKTAEPNKLTIYGAGRIGITNGTWSFRMDRGLRPAKIIGIGKKENV